VRAVKAASLKLASVVEPTDPPTLTVARIASVKIALIFQPGPLLFVSLLSASWFGRTTAGWKKKPRSSTAMAGGY
jgi:hypothetical protein